MRGSTKINTVYWGKVFAGTRNIYLRMPIQCLYWNTWNIRTHRGEQSQVELLTDKWAMVYQKIWTSQPQLRQSVVWKSIGSGKGEFMSTWHHAQCCTGLTSRNKHDKNASNANDMTCCFINSLRGTSSPRLNSLIKIYGWRVFFIEVFYLSDCQSLNKFIDQKNTRKVCKRKTQD